MDRFEAMAILARVAEKGSFSAAGRELRLPLATVSRKLAELEGHLGVKLLHRTTRKVSLTAAGATYLQAAQRILQDVAAAERAAAGEFEAPRGELIVTAPLLFGQLHVLPVVTAFLAAYPEIDIQLLLSDRNLPMIEDQVDVAARIGRLPDTSLVATRLGQMRSVVCGSPRLLAGREIAHPEALRGLPAVTFFGPSAPRSWRFRVPGGKPVTVEISPRLAVSTAQAAVQAAVAGVGVTRVLHYQCVEAVQAGQLQLLLEAYEPEPVPVNLLHAARRDLPLKTRTFIEFAAARLSSATALQAVSKTL